MISVLVATYNGQHFIEKQLDSIRLQTRAIAEVIICDDCSTDGTVQIVKRYIDQHNLSHWKLLENASNLGHYHTFLKLCREASQPLVFFSDQDDIWQLHKIERLAPVLEEEQVAMVYCQSNFIDDQDRVIQEKTVSSQVRTKAFRDMLHQWPSGYQMGIKKEVLDLVFYHGFEQFEGFDYHDVLFGMISPLIGQVKEVDEVLDSHRIHLNNVTKSVDTKSFNGSRLDRLSYLEKVYRRHHSLQVICQQLQVSHETKVQEEHLVWLEARQALLRKTTIKHLKRLLAVRRSYYKSKDFYSDVIYALGLDGWANKLVKIVGR